MKPFKKTIALLMLALFFASSVGAHAFDDVTVHSPYFDAVEYLKSNDVFKDGKLFKPESLINRAEFIKYLVLLNSPDFKTPKTIKFPFEDTRVTAWYAPYLNEAINLGIVDTGVKRFEPEKKLVLVDALEFLFKSRGVPIPRTYKGDVPYLDLQKNQRVQGIVMKAITLNLITPQNETNVGIYRRITKGEAALMIFRMDYASLVAPAVSPKPVTSDVSLKKFLDTWDIVQNSYLHKDEIDKEALMDKALKALVDGLGDPYSAYLNSNENQAFSDDLEGQVEGIGAFIAVNEAGDITVVSPIKNSPAEKAGVKSGDIIESIDGTSVKGLTLYEAVGKIKGRKGTTVKLTVKRNGDTLTLSVIRDVVEIPTVESSLLENDSIIHIKIFEFNQKVSNQFADLADMIQKNPKIKGIILDLRDDPGGLLDVALNMLNHLIPSEQIAVTIEYSYFNVAQYATGLGELSKYPKVVLINKGSASASEIVAGALKDHKLATLVGETSFGKGTVQEVNYFNDNSSLKVTIARWLTPNGTSIQGNGITPDIEVKNEKGSQTDNQLQRAITELKKKF